MPALLGILGIIVFLLGCYFMGNAVLKTFNEPLPDRIMASLFGILLWFAIAAVVLICWAIYGGLSNFVGNFNKL
jgi:hypothetical protein